MRALTGAGYVSLSELAGVPRSELASLHGVGPKALRMLEQALADHGLELKSGENPQEFVRTTGKPASRIGRAAVVFDE